MPGHIEYMEALAEILPRFRYYAYRQLGTDADVDEVLQETFVELARQPQPEHLIMYCRQTLRFQIINLIATRKKERFKCDLRRVSDNLPGPFDLAIRSEKQRRLAKALKRLPSNHAEIMARCLDGQTRPYISIAMHLTYDQYRNVRHLAKSKLTKCLAT